MGLAWAVASDRGCDRRADGVCGRMLVLLRVIGPEEKRVLNRLRGSRGAEENERHQRINGKYDLKFHVNQGQSHVRSHHHASR